MKNRFVAVGLFIFMMLFISGCTPGNGASGIAPEITSAGNVTFTIGTAGTFTVTATGTPTPTFSLGGDTLPAGVTFDETTGVLSGTPDAGTGGTYDLTITAQNGVSPDATQNFTLTVGASAAMIISNSGPWSVIGPYQDGMNQVFGTGSWDQLDIATETGAAFAPGSPYKFIYLEGSDAAGPQLVTYLAAHITAIETWVNNGGRLYINAATQGPNVSAPFGVLIEYGYSANTVNAVNASHPVFIGPYTPISTTYNGSSFAHNRIVGTGLTNILVNASDATMFCLSEAVHGSGLVVYGGTTYYGVTGTTEVHNFYMNLLYYAAGLGN